MDAKEEKLKDILKREGESQGIDWTNLSTKNLMEIWNLYGTILPCEYESEVEFIEACKKIIAKERGILVIPTSLEIINMDCEIEWLIDKVLPKQAISLLFGKGGIGKTWLSLQLSRAIAEGMPFLGFNTQKTSVVYINFEDPRSVLKQRLETVGTSSNFYIWHLSHEPPPPKLDCKKWELYKKLPQESLLIFDTLRAAHHGDENSSLDMAKIMEKLKELRELGYTILLLHHTPKSSNQIYKGSTAIFDLVDHVLCLEKDDGQFKLSTKDKTRFELFEAYLSFDKEKGFELTGDPSCLGILEIMHQMTKEGQELSQQNIVEKARQILGWGRDRVLYVLKKGERTYWDCRWAPKGHKLIYAPLDTIEVSSNFRPLYISRKSENTIPKLENTLKENQGKTLTSSGFSDFRDPLLENQKIPKDTPFNKDQNEDFEYDL